MVQLIALNKNETPNAFLERLLTDTHRLFSGKLLSGGPRDKRLLKGLLKSVPGIGELLAALVGDEKRPGWLRFADYAKALSAALADKGDRFVLIVDPDPSMQAGQEAEWFSIAGKLPPGTRLLIAQRPDDVVAADPESRRRFRTIPASGALGQLDEKSIEDWYAAEFSGGLLSDVGRAWSTDVRRELVRTAYRRYGGYPLAHSAVVRLLVSEEVDEPVARIEEWPEGVSALMDMLFESLARQGDERLRAALMLAVFGVPAPKDPWVQATGIAAETMISALSDARYRHFFVVTESKRYTLFHQLFTERLERELSGSPALASRLASEAWATIEPELEPDKLATSIPGEFELHAASNVAVWLHDKERELDVVFRVSGAKRRLGQLDAAVADMTSLIERHGEDETVLADCYSNLGLVYKARGDLKRAEEMHRMSLAIDERLGQIDGIANQYRNLGIICRARGDLERAEEMHRESLAIEKKLGRPEGMASQYGNLGAVYQVGGDQRQAEEMYYKSLEISEKIGWLEGIATASGNLALVHMDRGDLDRAEEMARKSFAIYAKLGQLEGMANQYGNLGLIYEQRGDLAAARDLGLKARDLFEQIGARPGMERVQAWLDELPEEDSQPDGPPSS